MCTLTMYLAACSGCTVVAEVTELLLLLLFKLPFHLQSLEDTRDAKTRTTYSGYLAGYHNRTTAYLARMDTILKLLDLTIAALNLQTATAGDVAKTLTDTTHEALAQVRNAMAGCLCQKTGGRCKLVCSPSRHDADTADGLSSSCLL